MTELINWFKYQGYKEVPDLDCLNVLKGDGFTRTYEGTLSCLSVTSSGRIITYVFNIQDKLVETR